MLDETLYVERVCLRKLEERQKKKVSTSPEDIYHGDFLIFSPILFKQTKT